MRSFYTLVKNDLFFSPTDVRSHTRRRMDTRQCASKNTEPRRRVDTKRCATEDAGPRKSVDCEIPHRLKRGMSVSEDVGPERGWIVRSHIGWRDEQNIFLYGCGNLSLVDVF